MKKNLEAIVQIRPSDLEDYSDALEADLVDAQARLDSEFASLLDRSRGASYSKVASVSPKFYNEDSFQAQPTVIKGGRSELGTSDAFFDYEGDTEYIEADRQRFLRSNDYEAGARGRELLLRRSNMARVLGACSLNRFGQWYQDWKAKPLVYQETAKRQSDERLADVIQMPGRRHRVAEAIGKVAAVSLLATILITSASKDGASWSGLVGNTSARAAQSDNNEAERAAQAAIFEAEQRAIAEEVARQQQEAAERAQKEAAEKAAAEEKAAQEAAEIAAAEERERVAAKASAQSNAASSPTTVAVPHYSSPNLAVSSSQARQLAHLIAGAEYGYSPRELDCLDRLWGGKESGYKPGILNPSSWAVGVPQAFPGTKIYPDLNNMEKYYDADGDLVLANPNAEREIRWGLDYIVERPDYQGSACAALNLHHTRGWY